MIRRYGTSSSQDLHVVASSSAAKNTSSSPSRRNMEMKGLRSRRSRNRDHGHRNILPVEAEVAAAARPATTATSMDMVNSQEKVMVPLKRCVTLEDGDVAVRMPNKRRRRSRGTVQFTDTEAEVIPPTPATATATAITSTLEDTWYTRQDYASFRKDLKMDYLIHVLLKKRSPDAPPISIPSDHCIRGLEKICCNTNNDDEDSSITASRNKGMRQQRIQAVLDQQQVQRFIGKPDPEILGTIAQVLSHRACDQAREQAEKDANSILQL